jgi:hypothetical protein
MTAISIAVVWLVVGVLVAAAFGAAVRRTRWDEDEDGLPTYRGAEVRYLRKPHSPDARAVKKQATRRNAAA